MSVTTRNRTGNGKVLYTMVQSALRVARPCMSREMRKQGMFTGNNEMTTSSRLFKSGTRSVGHC